MSSTLTRHEGLPRLWEDVDTADSRSVSFMSDAVLYELDGHVATITYNRPQALNAVNGEMRSGLNEAFARFRDEEDAWVAVVTGAGRILFVSRPVFSGVFERLGSWAVTVGWARPGVASPKSQLSGCEAGHAASVSSLFALPTSCFASSTRCR